jgi:hypothetical protein
MESQRAVVDYGLARRATLEALRSGGPTCLEDVCDAHPYLLRAARHHGEPTAADCPVCRRERLVHVSYVYGDELGRYAGRVKAGAELAEMARVHREFRVYVVEVCTGCAWNHLVQTYLLGTGGRRGASGRADRGGAAREVARR